MFRQPINCANSSVPGFPNDLKDTQLIKAQIRRARDGTSPDVPWWLQGVQYTVKCDRSVASSIQGAGGYAPSPGRAWPGLRVTRAAASPLDNKMELNPPPSQASWPQHLGMVPTATPQAAQTSPTTTSGSTRPTLSFPLIPSLGPCFQLKPHQFQVFW